jgi:signal peptidase I
VAVFKLPTDTNIDYIKRVIGLPGDTIQMRDGVLFINNQPVPKKRIEDYTELADGGDGPVVSQYEETLPNGVTFRVLDTDSNGSADNTEEYVVPEGHYFMMGDNRDNSQDSRYLSFVGYVPIENFVGRADIIFFSISPDASLLEVWRWPFVIRWNRLFKTL